MESKRKLLKFPKTQWYGGMVKDYLNIANIVSVNTNKQGKQDTAYAVSGKKSYFCCNIYYFVKCSSDKQRA